jgi:hypothetical protein
MAAILLFPLDVGIRRIQLEQEELYQAWMWIRRNILFMRSKHQQTKHDEAMEALLKRKEAVRSKQSNRTAPTPRSDLFAPEKEDAEPADIFFQPNTQDSTKTPSGQKPEPDKAPGEDEGNEGDGSMASRLLAAKRKNIKKPKP